MLEDREVFMADEVVEEEEGVREDCLGRSWSPGLSSPTFVAPVFIMAGCQKNKPRRIPQKKSLYNNILI